MVLVLSFQIGACFASYATQLEEMGMLQSSYKARVTVQKMVITLLPKCSRRLCFWKTVNSDVLSLKEKWSSENQH